ncbi:dual specificity protein phosphatase 15 isoform X1 [Bactrocera dorsalis]|uniref:Dual specificity protein phosphatase 15 isoform X1 n=1 Tax=Bactrocera dorsalis TaxID=27457 RepID=A0A6I9UY43_BACDO|nr:dual specificity protein phosphatase 15 isoform X1 [Bactrocera dorsalis]XP_049314431.1 dual specificity protein phosphatase 15 isoform X1 [Bactrocera dorsalis]XP_049314432.1 dual specificity protein phosphatase 15 isoform X1 [Bactrocera dorsalis]
MGNGMNKVLPGLYVGNYRDSKDQQQLDKHQITHIIAIHDSPRRLLPDKHYLCVMAADTPDQNLSQYFSVCNDFIHAARLREGNVLIHCLAGMSRSVTVAVAYIMTATNLSWKEALKVVRAGRAVANPNIGFQTQLQEFEMYRLMEERRRLRERFPSTALEHLDRSKCSAALDNYQELLQNRDICEGNCTRGEKCPTGVCNMDPSKGLFRRRPSSASTRSRLRGQPSTSSASASPSISAAGLANVIATNVAQSCPTSPSHSPATRRSLGTQKIPEDEEAQNPPIQTTTTTTTAQINNATTTTTNNSNTTTTSNTNTTTNTTTAALSPLIATASSSKEAAEYAAAINDAKREREALHKSPPAARMRNPRVNSAGSRLISGSAKARAAASATVAAQQQQDEMVKCTTTRNGGVAVSGNNGQAQLQRSASTVSDLTVRPYSSPAGLHAYTGKVPGSVPSSVHGSRVDLRDPDKGSAIYLGCSAPRNSTLSLSSRTSSGSSAPPSPVRTPPVSPRHGIRRAATVVKKQQQR